MAGYVGKILIHVLDRSCQRMHFIIYKIHKMFSNMY